MEDTLLFEKKPNVTNNLATYCLKKGNPSTLEPFVIIMHNCGKSMESICTVIFVLHRTVLPHSVFYSIVLSTVWSRMFKVGAVC